MSGHNVESADRKIRLAIVGMGKIARDQHVPALAASSSYELVAVASPHHKLDGVANFPDLDSLLAAIPELDAVSICTPPQVRYEVARSALERGKHVLLEKPPGATLNEVEALTQLATRKGVTLFATWHSREAAAVEPARSWLAGRTLRRVDVTWKEDVRVWHPGQAWIWKAGGLGVFDPGINALSILTRLLPNLVLCDAELSFPSNCETPIAASLLLSDEHATEVRMELDFLQTGPQSWDIDIETDTGGRLLLSKGGSVMSIDGRAAVAAPDREYASLYAHFATLVRERRIDVDVTPLRLVADAFMCGRRVAVAPFVE